MNEPDREMAERIASTEGRSPWFVEHGRELYPVEVASTTLPEDVLKGLRNPTKKEAREALTAQGYTLD